MTKWFGFWRAVLAVLAAPALSWPSSVQAQDTCATFSTPAFFSAATPGQVRSCIEEGADVLAADSNGLTPIFHAVRHSPTPTVIDALLAGLQSDKAVQEILSHRDREGRSIMHIAAAEATDPAVITWLALWGAEVSLFYDCGPGLRRGCTYPIHLAAQRDDSFLFVATLMALGSKVDVLNKNGRSPGNIHRSLNGPRDSAAALRSPGIWSYLVQSPRLMSPVSTLPTNCEDFLTADFFQRATAVEVDSCLISGSLASATDLAGNTAVHLAAANTGDPRILDLLLHSVYVADPDRVGNLLSQTNLSRRSALHYAAEFSSAPEVVGRLLAWGADVDQLAERGEQSRIRADRGTSALHIAARRADPMREQVLTVLLAGGANTTLQDYGSDNTGGRQALHYASRRPDLRIFRLLSRAELSQRPNRVRLGEAVGRAYPVVQDDKGLSAFHVATDADANPEILADMIKFGFSPDEADGDGVTPLMLAARRATDPNVFYLLLDNAEKPCIQANSGATVEAYLHGNANLLSYDPAGAELSPLAAYKARCPS